MKLAITYGKEKENIYVWLGASIEELRIRYRIIKIRPKQVSPETLGRFVGHLDAVLEDGDREGRGRVAGQPQTEGRTGLLAVCDQLLADLL